MTLRRSKSGLQSMHRFVNSDIVVYCEGGRISPPGTNADNIGTTLDIYYWSKVVGTFAIDKKFHFKSVGSKSSLRKIAEDADAGGITTISVCIDADYEPYIGFEFNTTRTSRTFGYSWENDVLSEEVFLEVIQDLIGVGENQSRALAEIRSELDRLRGPLANWTEIDISLKKLGKGCLFDREKPQSCLDFENPPKLRTAALRAKLIALGYVRRPRRVVEVHQNDVFKVCYGKLISKTLYHYAVAVLVSFGLQKPQYDLFMRSAIAATFRRYAQALGGALETHHLAQRRCFT